MSIAKLFCRVTLLLLCSLAVILTLLLGGNRDKAAAQSTSDVAAQNATPQNQSKRPAKRTSDMPGAVSGATYVGSDTCKNCHDEIYSKHFEVTPHFALLKGVEHGCEDCHGPGSAHV